MASNSLWLCNIIRQADPPEQYYEDIQGALQPLRLPRAQESIVFIEQA